MIDSRLPKVEPLLGLAWHPQLRRGARLSALLIPSVLIISCFGQKNAQVQILLSPPREDPPSRVEFACGTLTLTPRVTCEGEVDRLVPAEAELEWGSSQKGWFRTKCDAKGRIDWVAECASLPRPEQTGRAKGERPIARTGVAITVVMDATAECSERKGLVAAAFPVHRSILNIAPEPVSGLSRVRLVGGMEVFRQTTTAFDSTAACTLTIGTDNISIPLGTTVDYVATLPPGTHELRLDCSTLPTEAVGIRCEPPRSIKPGALIRQSADSWTQRKMAAKLVLEASLVDENATSNLESEGR